MKPSTLLVSILLMATILLIPLTGLPSGPSNYAAATWCGPLCQYTRSKTTTTSTTTVTTTSTTTTGGYTYVQIYAYRNTWLWPAPIWHLLVNIYDANGNWYASGYTNFWGYYALYLPTGHWFQAYATYGTNSQHVVFYTSGITMTVYLPTF